jgi:ABC-type Zn uptake system ZnuABC Zn-binding protein ZnuA
VDGAPEAVLQVTPGHRDIFLDRAQASTRKLARAYEDMKTMVAQVEAPDRIVITNQDTFACLGKRL